MLARVAARKRRFPAGTDDLEAKRVRADEETTPPPPPPVADLEPDLSGFRDMTIADTPVDRRQFRRIGPYILGPRIGNSLVENIIVQYLAKKAGTNEFVQLKVSYRRVMAVIAF